MKFDTEVYEIRIHAELDEEYWLSDDGWKDVADKFDNKTAHAKIIDGYTDTIDCYMLLTVEWNGSRISYNELRELVDEALQEYLEELVPDFFGEDE